MTEVSYNYTISTAFDQGLNVALLQTEVIAAALGQILRRIDTVDNTLSIIFGGTLSAGNQTTLNTVVANHVGNASSNTDVSGQLVDYLLDLQNTNIGGGGGGLNIRAGEVLGDIAVSILDTDETFKIMELEASQGYVTLSKTYAQTLIDTGTVYGLDNQNTSNAVDFNTQSGVYRKGGTNVVDVTETLTNKTITDPSNNVSVKGLESATTTVSIGSATAPSVGDMLIATSNTVASWQYCPFSSYFQQNSSDGESTSTSVTFQEKVSLSTISLPSGTYRIGWMYEWSHSSTNSSFVGRVQLNNTTILMDHREEPQDGATAQYRPNNGYYYAVGISGVQLIDLDFAISATTSTARIRRARLEIWRVA